MLKASNELSKGGFTAVGRALMKHSHREGTVFPKIQGNSTAVNAQGETVPKSILENPAVTVTKVTSRSVGEVLDYKIPGGMGVRFSLDGSKFIGFLEP